MLKMRVLKSMTLRRRLAAMAPSGTPMSMVMVKAASASSSVAGNFSLMSSATGRPLVGAIDSPRSSLKSAPR